MASPQILSRLAALAAALLFSTGGAVIKATSLTAWQVAGFRSGVAAAALLLLLPASRRGWSRRVPLAAAAYAGTMVLFVAANKLTTAANAIFLQSASPLYLLLVGPLLLGERVRAHDLTVMALIAAGMLLFFAGEPPQAATAPDPFRGNLCGALSGICWAFTVAGLRWLESRDGPGAGMPMVAAGNAMAFLFCLPPALPVRAAEVSDWLAVGYLGLFQIGLAYVCLTCAVRRLPALETSLLLLAEPALNPVWAWFVHKENPGGWALAGGALILAATLATALQKGDRRIFRAPAKLDTGS